MKRLIISILAAAVCYTAAAQSPYELVLSEIESNSSSLAALKEQMEAQKLANRTDMFLPNPEVEFNYLWGSPSDVGSRKDFKVSQSFDFPSAYAHRGKIAKLENANAELQYKSERMALLLSAKQVCIEIIYYNALILEYQKRLSNANQIARTYTSRLSSGDTNALEYNKTQLNLTTVEAELSELKTERSVLLSRLKSMNGGKGIAFEQSIYSSASLPSNFDKWYDTAQSKNPLLQYVSAQVEINQRQVKLNRAMSLPKFTAGYMSEKVVGERFQGISIGASIPLWENRNKVRSAKAEVFASEFALKDAKIEFLNRLQGEYIRASGMEQNAVKYRKSISDHNNEVLLKKALDVGEISLLEYLLEVEYYYEAFNRALEAERSLELSLAELSAVEL